MMRVDELNKVIYVRQSWLGDIGICPERARLGVVRPDFRTGSDATIIGTAIHTGIEAVLQGKTTEFADMLEVVANDYESLETSNYKKTNIIQEEIPQYLESMSLAFYNEILPVVSLGGKTEMPFKVPLNIDVDGYAVWMEGTMDYVDSENNIWDWKTAKRAYNIKSKQKSAIQPTVYTYAAHMLSEEISEPPTFNYGIMIRQLTPKSQIVPVIRTAEHWNWLKHQVRGAVSMALRTGVNNQWVTNDESALCSESWCSFWSICKGAYNCNNG
jgi:hypothetical protein